MGLGSFSSPLHCPTRLMAAAGGSRNCFCCGTHSHR